MRRIDLLVIHCSASRPNQHLTFEMLDNMHRAKGWNGCGYHYYIMIKWNTVKKILQIVATVITTILGTNIIQSCMNL